MADDAITAEDDASGPPQEPKKSRLTRYIVIGIVAAVIAALVVPEQAARLHVGGEIFLRLLKMVVTAAHDIVSAALASGRRLIILNSIEINGLQETSDLVRLIKEKICTLAVSGSVFS